MIISIDKENYSTKSNTFVIKTLNKLEIKGSFFNLIKTTYEKPTANMIIFLTPHLLQLGLKHFEGRNQSHTSSHSFQYDAQCMYSQ